MQGEIKLGSVVKSKQGRDEGKLFLVVSIVNEEYVHLLDGNLRKLGNEKLKKTKHVKSVYKDLPELTAQLSSGLYVNDSDIRKALEAVKIELES